MEEFKSLSITENEVNIAKAFVNELTNAQRKTLELISTGLSNSKVSEILDIHKKTVESHTRHIYRVLDSYCENEEVISKRSMAIRLAHVYSWGRNGLR